MKFSPGPGRVKKWNRKRDKKQHRLIKKLKIVICTFKLKEKKRFLGVVYTSVDCVIGVARKRDLRAHVAVSCQAKAKNVS